jgi:ABC-2 type transport system ATP-binding protein
MRRRLDIAASIVVTLELMFLDEPTTGLDPRSRNQVWDIVNALVGEGTTVLLCTQYLDEADQLAHRIAVIDHGRVIAEGTPGELKSQAGRDVVEVHARRPEDLSRLADALAALGVEAPRTDLAGRRVTVPVDIGPAAVTAAVRAVEGLDIELDDIGLRRPTLDEVFLTLTGRPADGEADADAA